MRDPRRTALLRAVVTAIAVMLVGMLPLTHAMAAQPNKGGSDRSSSQSGGDRSGKNKPSQRGGGEAKTMNPRPQQSAPRNTAPSGPGTGAPGNSSPGGSTPGAPKKPTTPRKPIPKPDRSPHKFSPNTKAPSTNSPGSSRGDSADDRDDSRSGLRDNYSRDRNSRDKSDDSSDRRSGPQQNRGPNKVAPNPTRPGGDRSDRRDSGRPGDNDKSDRQPQSDRDRKLEPSPTPAPSTPRERDPESRRDDAPEAPPRTSTAPTTPKRDESGRDDKDPPARILSPPLQKADPNGPNPRTPNITGTPKPDGDRPGQTPQKPPVQLLDDDDEPAAPGISDKDDDRVDQAVDDVLRDNGFKPYSGHGAGQSDFGFSIYTGWGPGLEEVVRSGDLGERSTGDPELDKIVLEHLARHAEQIAAAGGGKGGWGPLILEGLSPDPDGNGLPGGAAPGQPRKPIVPGTPPKRVEPPKPPAPQPPVAQAPPVTPKKPVVIPPGTPPPASVEKLPNGSYPRNSRYAGERMELPGDLKTAYPNGVEFSDKGFPQFDEYAKESVQLPGGFTTRATDKRRAMEILRQQDPNWTQPPNTVWHHKEDGTTMQLVPKDIHTAVGHDGGAK